MSIRNARMEDKHVLTALAKRCEPQIRPTVVGTYEFLARCFQSTFFVYEEEGEIKAYMVGFPNVDVKGEIWIYQICVHESLRGKRVGTQLFDAFMKTVKEQGYKTVLSQVTNDISIKLHEKFGLEKKELDPERPDKPSWIMAAKI